MHAWVLIFCYCKTCVSNKTRLLFSGSVSVSMLLFSLTVCCDGCSGGQRAPQQHLETEWKDRRRALVTALSSLTLSVCWRTKEEEEECDQHTHTHFTVTEKLSVVWLDSAVRTNWCLLQWKCCYSAAHLVYWCPKLRTWASMMWWASGVSTVWSESLVWKHVWRL